jgi:hypothetical protein
VSEELLRELIEEATRDVPANVLRPPLAQIRRRAARRRIVWPASISALLSALIMAAGLALAPAGPGPDPAPIPSIPTFTWSHAYVAAGGRALTIYLFRPGRCGTLTETQATVSEFDSAVTVTMTGGAGQ